MLKIQLLHKDAKAPTVAHPGEDLGYDLYALEDTNLTEEGQHVKTGIAAELTVAGYKYGFVIKDRSSMAAKGIVTSGGVIDAGYRGEITVTMTDTVNRKEPYIIKKGDKIAQMVPIKVNTFGEIQIVKELGWSKRGIKAFGSSGK